MQLHERSFGGFRLSPKPPTRWDEGSSSRCSRRQREAQSCRPISPCVQQYSLTPTASRNSTKTIKSTRLTTDDKKDQKNPVETKSSRKGPFSTGGIRLHKKWPSSVIRFSVDYRSNLKCHSRLFFFHHFLLCGSTRSSRGPLSSLSCPRTVPSLPSRTGVSFSTFQLFVLSAFLGFC